MFGDGVTAYFTVNERTDVTGNYVIDGDCNRYTSNVNKSCTPEADGDNEPRFM